MGNDFLFILMNYFFPFPLFVIGMSFGVGGCMIALAFFFTTLFILLGAAAASSYLLLYGLPTLLLVKHALSQTILPDQTVSWPSFGRVLEMAVVIALVGCIFLSFVFLQENVISQLQQDFQENFQTILPDPSQVETLFLFLPGLIIIGWTFLLLGNEFLAQKLVSYCKYNIRPDFHFNDILCPRWLLYTFVASSVLGGLVSDSTLGFISKNIALITGMALFLNGLSLIHRVIKTVPYSPWVLFLFYLLFFFSIWLSLIIIAFGIAETLLRLKERISV